MKPKNKNIDIKLMKKLKKKKEKALKEGKIIKK